MRTRPLGLVMVFLAGALSGCAPVITCQIETVITANLMTARKITITGRPGEELPNQRVKLHDYLEFPDAELYENFVLTPEKAIMAGRFDSPEQMTTDFIKRTPETDRLAKNRILFRSLDLVLLQVIEFEEQIGDIVSRADGEQALRELAQLLLDLGLQVLHDLYDQDYDLSGLDAYMKREFPGLIERLYASLWELRRSRRGGIDMQSENREWLECLARESNRLGVPAAEPGGDHSFQAMLMRFLDENLGDLVTPRRPDVRALDSALIKDKQARGEILAAFQRALLARKDNTQAVLARIDPLLPRVFGAFLINQVSLLPVHPAFEFHVRLTMPGHLVQTNGLRDLDGRILWSFTDSEIALSGYAMWARSMVLRENAVEALGLADFPGQIHQVERFYRCLRVAGKGDATRTVLQRLAACVQERSFAPLEALARGETEDGQEVPKPLRDCAQQVLGFLAAYRKPADSQPGGEAGPPPPAEAAPELPSAHPGQKPAPLPEMNLGGP